MLIKLPSGEYYTVRSLLSKGKGNKKLAKSDAANAGYLTVGLSLAPANLSGYEMCRGRSKECTRVCLNTSGHGRANMVQNARIAKTIMLMEHREEFMSKLGEELTLVNERVKRSGAKLACRLNVFSDFPWEIEEPEIFSEFPDVQFYDYTKILSRASNFHAAAAFPKNYYLLFSQSESNESSVNYIVNQTDVNLAVVFSGKNLPEEYKGRRVIDGDITDLRFLDPRGVVVGLTPKGKAIKEGGKFIVSLPMVN